MKKSLLLIAAAFLAAGTISAQVRNEMKIPNIDGYVTLKGDMHMHTIFSDASVWPTTRVDEAVMEGLDFLCITDHVDGRLHKYLNSGYFDPKNVDNNTSFKLAEKQAKGTGLILVPGGEITSQIMPPGHFNATFVKDANPIGAAMDAHGKDHQPEGLLAACKIAKGQGAFLTWNHPHWCRQAPNKTVFYEEHEQMVKDGLMDAVEVYNWWEGYSPEAHHWAIEHGLAIVSGTDSHHPMFMDIDFNAGELRPVTLVFAKERSLSGLREGLDAHRTAIFAEGKVYGPEELILPLLKSCLRVEKILWSEKTLKVYIYNRSSIPVTLDKAPGSEQWQMARHLTINPFEHYMIQIYRLDKNDPLNTKVFDLHYTVDNFFTDADTRLEYVLHVDAE